MEVDHPVEDVGCCYGDGWGDMFRWDFRANNTLMMPLILHRPFPPPTRLLSTRD
jgi:hypothetical protein